MVADPTNESEGLHGRNLAIGIILLCVWGAAYVGWKYIKHNWLVDHGYLPEGMRDYWVVFGVTWIGIIILAAKRRFRM